MYTIINNYEIKKSYYIFDSDIQINFVMYLVTQKKLFEMKKYA